MEDKEEEKKQTFLLVTTDSARGGYKRRKCVEMDPIRMSLHTSASKEHQLVPKTTSTC
jgi:hypothetical protein